MAGSLFYIESPYYGNHTYCVSPDVAKRSNEINTLVSNPTWRDIKMAEFDARATTATSSTSRREPVSNGYGLELASLTIALSNPIEPARVIHVMDTLAQTHPELVKTIPHVRGSSHPSRPRQAA